MQFGQREYFFRDGMHVNLHHNGRVNKYVLLNILLIMDGQETTFCKRDMLSNRPFATVGHVTDNF